MLLGAHVSTAGGVHYAPENGVNLGCTAIQIFAKNQRQWTAKPLSPEEVKLYLDNLAKTDIKSVVSHDSYLINMASPDAAMRSKSTAAFVDEIERAKLLKLDGIVFHPGSHMGEGDAKGIATISKSLDEAIEKSGGKKGPMLLIETTAGQGTNLGSRFEHIRDIIASVKEPSRFGVCVDTCHLFGAGYSLADSESYKSSFAEFDKIIGLDRIKCFHINDSKQPLSSHKDRHDNIGSGLIGNDAFKMLMNDPRFENVPKILETPGGDEAYMKDLKLLRSFVKK
ncbi:MAG: deoxyribonuclease IV [Fibrobacteres bacterium]|nr:deoxyribonuclease IV [Fibrobacterota bacterium]